MSTTIDRKIASIKKSLHINTLLNKDIDTEYIKDYYKKNRLAYSLFHNRSGFVHMAISRDGAYKNNDLQEHVNFIQKYIDNAKATKVLELATGRGANLIHLAERNPNVLFYGLDISTEQLDYSSGGQTFKNVQFTLDDFHNLGKFKEKAPDIVFIIEALCHSEDTAKVLSEVYNILPSKGYFIIFDGYLKKDLNKLSENELLAKSLTEKGMAVGRFDMYDEFLSSVKKFGFILEYQEDLSKFIIPNLHRFEKIAGYYFKIPLLAKIIAKVFPDEFIFNSVSGYLMPTLIKEGIASYNVTVLKKP